MVKIYLYIWDYTLNRFFCKDKNLQGVFMYFNQNVKYLCTTNNISQTNLAKLLNTSKQSLNSILNTNNPTARVVIDISNIFKISIDDLLLKDLSKN